MKVLMQAFSPTMDVKGHRTLEMTAFCNTSKDKGMPVLSFSLTLVIKKPQLRLFFENVRHTKMLRKHYMHVCIYVYIHTYNSTGRNVQNVIG